MCSQHSVGWVCWGKGEGGREKGEGGGGRGELIGWMVVLLFCFYVCRLRRRRSTGTVLLLLSRQSVGYEMGMATNKSYYTVVPMELLLLWISLVHTYIHVDKTNLDKVVKQASNAVK